MEEHHTYGHRRIALALGMNHKKTRRLMRLYHLKPRLRRGYRLVKPDDRGQPETPVDNVLKAICPIQPNIQSFSLTPLLVESV